MRNMIILIGSDNMKSTFGLMPHEILKILRSGEEMRCGHCKEGIIKPVGDYEKTNTFRCSKCKKELIIN